MGACFRLIQFGTDVIMEGELGVKNRKCEYHRAGRTYCAAKVRVKQAIKITEAQGNPLLPFI